MSVPRKLGKYRMLETIGKGGFSKVKLGVDEESGKNVALKILKKKAMGNESTIKQVEREIMAMSKIQHDNVIRLVDVQWDCTYEKKNGQKEEVILVVLELATGGELFDFLAFTGPFEEAVARTYFHQLIFGVHHCHLQGVAHRDLKPENVLLDDKYALKIADFGFSTRFDDQHKMMFTECGTPGYMSPEIFTRKGYDAAVSDIWSCGVILFIMLAGFPPFQRPAMNDWWFNKLASGKHHLFWEAHQRSCYFSENFKDLINKILCPEPSKRIKMEDIQKHAWFMGPTMSNPALLQELNRRKVTVDECKERERLAKHAEQNRAQVGGFGEDAVMRGNAETDAEADLLPGATPNISAFNKLALLQIQEQEYGASEDALANGFAAELSFDDNKVEEQEDGEKTVVPEFDEKLFPISFTRFSTKTAPASLVSRITHALTSLKVKHTVRAKEYSIRAREADAEFSIQVYKAKSDSDEYIVDFRKRAGESTTFRTAFVDIKNKLADLVIVKPVENSAAEGQSS